MKVNFAPDFENLLPKHSTEELAQLEVNYLDNPDSFPPCILWEDGPKPNTMIEGHARYRLSVKHGRRMKFVKMRFASRGEALTYAVACQSGRRNVDKSILAMLVLKYPPKVDDARHPTNRELAEAAHTTTRTIQRAKKVVRNGSAETIAAVENGEMSVNAAAKELEKPRQSGKQVSDPRLWAQWQHAYDKLAQATDSLLKNKNLLAHREGIQKHLNAAFTIFETWRKA